MLKERIKLLLICNQIIFLFHNNKKTEHFYTSYTCITIMEEIITRIKKWGNSFGVILPKHIIREENLKVNTEVMITLQNRRNTKVKDIFGILGTRRLDTEKLLKEVDKELWKDD